MYAIELYNVTKKFNNFTAIDNISFKLKKKDTLILIGPNGAGKTTLERLISGLYLPTSGDIFVLGKNTKIFSNYRNSFIGYVGENYALYDNLTVKSNLLFFSSLYKLDPNISNDRIEALLKEFNAIEFLNTKVGNLSRGTKQKIAICRALLFEPRVLILDEPTAFLDPNSAEILRRKLIELKKNTTIIYATQRLDELTRLNGKILLLNKGRKVAFGNLEEILHILNGIEVEIVVARNLSKEEIRALSDFYVYNNRIVIKLKRLADLPRIVKEISNLNLPILTINYINYELNL